MQYQVPQFIEIEDKIFGPLSFRQFLFLGGGLGLAYICFTYLPLFLGLPLAGASAALGIALAFWKVNNKPFIHVLEAFFKFLFNARLYVWRKVPKKKKVSESNKTAGAGEVPQPKLTGSTLKDLAWSLDIHEREGKSNL